MEITTIGVDLAKTVFQVHGMNAHGKTVVRKRLSRDKFLTFFANLPPCLVAMEACGSSNFWARHLQALGHDARLISPQFVKPYVKTNKNDLNDAEAICEAATRPQMRFVPMKSIEQQDIQAVHRVRQLLVQQRTALVNQARGLLREYGVFIPAGIRQFRHAMPGVLEDAENELTDLTRQLMADLYQCLLELDQQIADYERRIQGLSRERPVCQRMEKVEGVGVLTATALMATVGDAKVFKNGRQMSAWLGLVPRQHSTVFQGLEMRVDDSRNSQWVDIAQIVVHEDIAEAANFPPGNFRAAGLQRLRQVLGSLRQGLQIAQRCIVQDLVLSQITSRLDPSNLGDGIQNMLRIGMPGLVHKSTASRMTWSRI